MADRRFLIEAVLGVPVSEFNDERTYKLRIGFADNLNRKSIAEVQACAPEDQQEEVRSVAEVLPMMINSIGEECPDTRWLSYDMGYIGQIHTALALV